jgi:hypothetical protein
MFPFSYYQSDQWYLLTVHEKIVFYYLAHRGIGEGMTRVSVETITNELSINRKIVINATNRLSESGFIMKDNSNRRKTVYIINKELVPPEGTDRSVPPHGTRNKKEIKKRADCFSESSFEYRLAKKLWESIKFDGTAQKEPDLQKWSGIFDLIHRIDERPYSFIHKTMMNVRQDDFWKKNIRSPEKFREKLNQGKLDHFTPPEGEYLTDEELIKEDKEPTV